MFYSQDILQKRGGRFAKIWLAATKMSKLSRREVASVNVEKSCNEILAYIELRVPPAYQGGRRPRFSLYLSVQLMYGVVRIHSKNCEYLLSDASTTLIHVKSVPTLIDLQETPKADQVTNPDVLLEEVPAEQDLHLSQLDLDMETLRTGHVEVGDFWGFNGSSPVVPSPKKRRKKDKEEPILQVASVDQITLQEPPPLLVDTPLSPIQVPKDVELPMLDGREMDLLMGVQPEEPPLQVSDLLPTSTPFSADSAARQQLRSEKTTAAESPSHIMQEEREKTPARAPAVEEVPEARALPQSPGVTQIITSPLPVRQMPRKSLELELTGVVPSPTHRRRKRQLAFADAETQIPKTKMKQNMATGQDTCEEFVLPDVKGVAALDLLTVPGTNKLRKKPWLSLWTRNARFRRNIPEEQLAEAVSPPHLPALEEELIAPGQPEPQVELTAQEIPRLEETLQPQPQLSPVIPIQTEDRRDERKVSTLEESVEELRRISTSMMGTPAPEISSIEIPRDASTSHIQTPRMQGLDESLVLDDSRQSKKDRTSTRKRKTRSSVTTDEEQQAQPPAQDTLLSTTSLQTSHTSTGRTLYDVVEEPRFEEQFVAVPLLQSVSEDREHMQEELLRSITNDIEQQGRQYTTFRKICPPQLLDRKIAARKFTALLDLCAQGSVTARQKGSYEDIYIRLAE